MGRKPCCEKEGLRRGPWSSEEDKLLVGYIQEHGHGSWRSLPKNAGLLRCGKSCRLRWTNYLRPGVRRGPFSPEEEATIIQFHGVLGNKWAAIASQLPEGRTDNEVKNFWNTHLKKRLLQSECQGVSIGKPDLSSLKPIKMEHNESPATRHMVQWENVRVEAESRLSMQSSLLRSLTLGSFQCDPILQLWNSEVGESFRNIKGKDGKNARGSANSHSRGSSSVKLECDSHTDSIQAITIKAGTFRDISHDQEDAYKRNLKMEAGSDALSSNEFTDSSDKALKLLLDLPGCNDLDFVQCERGESLCDFLYYR